MRRGRRGQLENGGLISGILGVSSSVVANGVVGCVKEVKVDQMRGVNDGMCVNERKESRMKKKWCKLSVNRGEWSQVRW